jgi:hypothetical protein
MFDRLTASAYASIPPLDEIATQTVSVKRQSQIFLHSGGALLLFVITYVSFLYFAGSMGVAVAFLVIGVVGQEHGGCYIRGAWTP